MHELLPRCRSDIYEVEYHVLWIHRCGAFHRLAPDLPTGV
jgi:hypothetical protein